MNDTNTKNMTIRQLSELQQKHRAELEAKKNKIQERKKRSHRLIVRGLMAEALIPDSENLTDEEFKEKFYQLVGTK
ncbi:MAG: DUF3847 domain-containing protein [Lachnospiraceae bacterium]|nr:DUF3847 domain-containing protein [Lachnospiraceae bacterium]